MTADAHPELAAHGTFAHLQLGRLPRRHDARTLQFAHYVDDPTLLPAIPDTFPLPPALAAVAWPMYGNDSLGDCTFAGAGHMAQAWSALAGHPVTLAAADVEAAYWETGDPPADAGAAGGPTDTGRVEIDVLNYWRSHGVGPDKIGAYVAVDPANHDHVRAALYLFGGLYTGQALPRSAQGQQVWDVVGDGRTGPSEPGSWGGHCVPYLPAWDGSTIQLVTWGAVIAATLAFHDRYCDELYAIVSADFLDGQGRTPQGFALDELNADLAAVTAAAAA